MLKPYHASVLRIMPLMKLLKLKDVLRMEPRPSRNGAFIIGKKKM
jgi:hypothetical protein